MNKNHWEEIWGILRAKKAFHLQVGGLRLIGARQKPDNRVGWNIPGGREDVIDVVYRDECDGTAIFSSFHKSGPHPLRA